MARAIEGPQTRLRAPCYGSSLAAGALLMLMRAIATLDTSQRPNRHSSGWL